MVLQSFTTNFIIYKVIILNCKHSMILSRTRKQIKNMESFYKEAGLDREIQNIYEKNTNQDSLNKKHRLQIKKKFKQANQPKIEVKTTSDKLQSDSSQEIHKQYINQVYITSLSTKSSNQSTLTLAKMINKISIIQVVEPNFIHGCYGHTTVIFKRPIIEGKYYLQFKINQANLNQKKAKIKCPPSIRVGICQPNYSKNSPLGLDLSLCYKGNSGNFVHNSVQIQGGQTIKQGNVIGLGISFSPSYKYLDRTKLWQDSQIVITKNGRLMEKSQKIYQTFYCPAFSLYNYASIEVRCDQNLFQYHLQGFKPYGCIFNQPLNYEVLKNKPQFAFLKQQQTQ